MDGHTPRHGAVQKTAAVGDQVMFGVPANRTGAGSGYILRLRGSHRVPMNKLLLHRGRGSSSTACSSSMSPRPCRFLSTWQRSTNSVNIFKRSWIVLCPLCLTGYYGMLARFTNTIGVPVEDSFNDITFNKVA